MLFSMFVQHNIERYDKVYGYMIYSTPVQINTKVVIRKRASDTGNSHSYAQCYLISLVLAPNP